MENEKSGTHPLNIDSLKLNNLEIYSLETHSLEAEDLLRWWQQQQIYTLNQEADFIRNNILQEVFTVRRHLELASDFGNRDSHLAKLKHIYSLLQQLNNRLDPPYLKASLPLALSHTIDIWRPMLPLEVSLPVAWSVEPISQTRLLITLINTLCAAINEPHTLAQSCEVSLRQMPGQKVLILCVTYCDIPPPVVTAQLQSELAPIIQTFQLLSKGSFTVNSQAPKIAWTISWP